MLKSIAPKKKKVLKDYIQYESIYMTFLQDKLNWLENNSNNKKEQISHW